MGNELSPIGLAIAIRDEYQLAETAAVSSLRHLLTVGEMLTQAKAQVELGGWHRWIETNLPFGVRQAQRYMSLFEHRDELETDATRVSHFGFRSAFALLTDERDNMDDNAAEQIQVDPTRRTNRTPQVEVIPTDSSETTDAELVDVPLVVPATPKTLREAYPESSCYPKLVRSLWKVRGQVEIRRDQGWSKPTEQKAEILRELRSLIDVIEGR